MNENLIITVQNSIQTDVIIKSYSKHVVFPAPMKSSIYKLNNAGDKLQSCLVHCVVTVSFEKEVKQYQPPLWYSYITGSNSKC